MIDVPLLLQLPPNQVARQDQGDSNQGRSVSLAP